MWRIMYWVRWWWAARQGIAWCHCCHRLVTQHAFWYRRGRIRRQLSTAWVAHEPSAWGSAPVNRCGACYELCGDHCAFRQ